MIQCPLGRSCDTSGGRTTEDEKCRGKDKLKKKKKDSYKYIIRMLMNYYATFCLSEVLDRYY